MKKIIFIAIAILFINAATPAEPTLLKRTVYIEPQKYLRYWKNPKAAEPVYDTNCWYPKIRFDVLGPIESGSRLYVEFDRANGTPWMKVDMFTPTIGDDVWETIKPEPVDSGLEEKLASIETGSFAFRIKYKNALEGIDKVLFAGKFKVGQLTLDQAIPENKGKKEFMVDYDWHLPIGYVWLNPQIDENVPNLAVQVMMRGIVEAERVEGFLFLNGKQVGKAYITLPTKLTSGADEPHHRYTIVQADFMTVRGFNRDSGPTDWSQNFFLDKNPGSYEIKITRDNQLARSIAFAVGKDGKIVDNGFARSINLGGVRMIFPAKMTGTLDGQINASAWQTDALFGNPIAGFQVQ